MKREEGSCGRGLVCATPLGRGTFLYLCLNQLPETLPMIGISLFDLNSKRFRSNAIRSRTACDTPPTAAFARFRNFMALGSVLACLSLSAPGLAASVGEELETLHDDLAGAKRQIQLAQLTGYETDTIAALEGVVRDLTGRVETLEHRLRQMETRIERLESVTQAPVSPTPESPGAYYQPPSESAPAQSGPRVLGTPQESFEQSGTESSGREEASPSGVAGAEGSQEEPSRQEAALPSGDAAAQYDQAVGLLRQARWGAADAARQACLPSHPEPPLAGNAKYWLGETYYVRGDYVAAARVFAEGFQEYPESSKAPDNLLKLGMSLAVLDRRDDACGTLRELERRYGDAPSQILQRSR